MNNLIAFHRAAILMGSRCPLPCTIILVPATIAREPLFRSRLRQFYENLFFTFPRFALLCCCLYRSSPAI